jgi:hypothetical protein
MRLLIFNVEHCGKSFNSSIGSLVSLGDEKYQKTVLLLDVGGVAYNLKYIGILLDLK